MMKNVECFESFEELFGKKKGKIKDKIKKLGDKIKQGYKGAAMLPVLAPIAAFSPMMKRAIKKRGQTPKKGLKNLAEQFFTVVVNKGAAKPENMVEDIALIVQSILQFIKKMNDNKKAGKATPEEEELLNEADKNLKSFDPDKFVDDDPTAKETSVPEPSDSEDTPSGKKDNTMLLVGAAVLLVILMKK